MLAKKREVDKVKSTIRKAVRIIFSLGPNVKNCIVEKLVSPNREYLWGKRLIQIKERWAMDNIYLNTIKNEEIYEKINASDCQNEVNLKFMNEKIIDVLNIFN